MGRRLSAGMAVAARTLLGLAALLATTAASLILARKLPVPDYAFYQTITKRVAWVSLAPVLIMSDWMYRYTAQRLPGTLEAVRLLVLISTVWSVAIGLAASLALTHSIILALAASVSLASLTLYTTYRTVVAAARPVRIALLVLAYRAMYAALIATAVYYLHCGALGAFTAATLAALITTALLRNALEKASIPSGGGRSVLAEWVKHIGPQALSTASTIMLSLDALIAASVASEAVVAGFFASNIAAALVREAGGWGLGYISAVMLAGRSATGLSTAFTAVAVAVAPLVTLAAVYPEHVIHIVNPTYIWAWPAESILALSSLAALFESYTFNIFSGSLRGRAHEVAAPLKNVYKHVLTINTIYVALLSAALHASEKLEAGNVWGAMLWAILYTSTTIARAAIYTRYLPPEAKIEALKPLRTAVKAAAIAAVAAIAFKPLEPPAEKTFLGEVATITPFATLVLAASYTLELLLVREARRLARRAYSLVAGKLD